ncbi:hypothetical protein A0H81_05122 [Grifola frondosa]|uniref:Uncharacterized protein n=1 Tax=Grifola frondosa TaxID=5627 RepID=A0A1C7MDF5_GRIFR|nr:hypothetical protein A0H81_05122 [Grifola frondosa]
MLAGSSFDDFSEEDPAKSFLHHKHALKMKYRKILDARDASALPTSESFLAGYCRSHTHTLERGLCT